MIRYDLICSEGHRFDGWFRSISAFDRQLADGLVSCPTCGDTSVAKALMAPAVSTARAKEARGIDDSTQATPQTDAPTAAPSLPTPVAAPMPPAPTPERVMALAQDSRVQELVHKMREIRDKVIATAEDVGDQFPEEARKMHYGEAEERGIYGEASLEDAEELLEEGIAVMPLPILPEDRN
ncbi:MAG: DUF1178 family protein [Pseudomonadota bacterium]